MLRSSFWWSRCSVVPRNRPRFFHELGDVERRRIEYEIAVHQMLEDEFNVVQYRRLRPVVSLKPHAKYL